MKAPTEPLTPCRTCGDDGTVDVDPHTDRGQRPCPDCHGLGQPPFCGHCAAPIAAAIAPVQWIDPAGDVHSWCSRQCWDDALGVEQ